LETTLLALAAIAGAFGALGVLVFYLYTESRR
jgi:hypothetical protein